VDGQLVITIVAQDRPGLVELLSGLITRHGGNWLESRMARLGGQFAGIIRISVPSDNRDRLISNLDGLASAGIRAQIQADEPSVAPESAARLAEFKLVGQDRPGIVMQISEVFARYGVNVEELTTIVGSAPMSGELLFQADAIVRIPQSSSLAELKKALEKIAADLMVDISFGELNPDTINAARLSTAPRSS
jgi:glycine cleavage system regulatory protein